MINPIGYSTMLIRGAVADFKEGRINKEVLLSNVFNYKLSKNNSDKLNIVVRTWKILGDSALEEAEMLIK